MKKIIILILFVFCFGLTLMAYANDTDDKITSLFKTAYYSGDTGVKVLEFKYKKVTEDEYESLWEGFIKIKSCYKMSVYCQTHIIVTDKEGNPISQGNKGNNHIATLFNKDIKKLGINEKTSEIYFNKKDINVYFKENREFAIYTDCGLNYDSNLLSKYPRDHKYWKQFFPKDNDCK